MSKNWLDANKRKDVKNLFQELADTTKGLPALECKEGVPIFFKTISESRIVGSQYGDREIVDVEIIEPLTVPENPVGTQLSMWLTQRVIVSKMKNFKNTNNVIPAGLELCIVSLGKRRGGSGYQYEDYWIGKAEDAKLVLKDIL